jgi:hypothetical protein
MRQFTTRHTQLDQRVRIRLTLRRELTVRTGNRRVADDCCREPDRSPPEAGPRLGHLSPVGLPDLWQPRPRRALGLGTYPRLVCR